MQANTGTVLCGCSLNCSSRCRLGTTVAEKLEEVNRLMNDRSFPAGLVEANPRVKSVEYIPGPSIQNQTTASANLEKIMSLLNDDAVRRIGIWGMGGVGKTTLVKNLNNSLQSGSLQQLFDIVIWVTVSKDFNLERAQTQIAERLNLPLNSKESGRRAIELYQRLEKEKKFLLILDDVWDAFDLDSLGVPQPEKHRGSNIILTSRFLEVCKGMRTDEEVKVEVLNSEEAWQLFVKHTGTETISKQELLARAVAKECSGLPLALITVGRAMAGKAKEEQWKYALDELRRSEPDIIRDIEKEVYNPLKLSYDSLQGKNVKPCFLYCSLFPEDWSIEVDELVLCWKAEGLMDEQQNFEDSRNRGISIIQILKDSCLLEEGDDEDTVKMHDVVRDVAIWIASSKEDDCKFVVQSGKGLSQISDVESLKLSKRISFMKNKITALPDCVIQCPKTSTLLLEGNLWLKRVPERFLQGFQVLRVLNMSRTTIQSLPLSLAKLGELRALILEGCNSLEELPPLGGLRKLQVLNLCDTRIKELPKGMEELSNLSQLLLRGTSYLERIEAGVLSKLSGLEVLDMCWSDYMWGVIGDEKEGQATFEELGYLTRLIVVHVNLHSLPCQDLPWVQRLRSFQITVGRFEDIYPELDERMVTLDRVNLSEKRIGWLLNNATHLELDSCEEIGWMFENIVTNTQGLAGLKKLCIFGCDIAFRGCAAPHDMLPNLEKLRIGSFFEVEGVTRPLVALLGLKFSRLRLIEVNNCPNLKYLIPAELIPNLINLEEIRVRYCKNLEKLFEYDNHTSSGQMVAADPLLPKLRKLELWHLPKLRSICRENESWQSLEVLHVGECDQLKRIPLTTQNANTIKEICGEEKWWDDLEWEDDDTKRTLRPYFRPSVLSPYSFEYTSHYPKCKYDKKREKRRREMVGRFGVGG